MCLEIDNEKIPQVIQSTTAAHTIYNHETLWLVLTITRSIHRNDGSFIFIFESENARLFTDGNE